MKLNGLCVVMPTKNEEGTIGILVTRLYDMGVSEVLVVDDSTDNTRLRAIMAKATVLPGRGMGLGAALRDGLMWATSRYEAVAVVDAGMTHDVGVLPRMFDWLWAGAEVVIASRFLKKHPRLGYRTWLSKTATWCVREVLGIKTTDATTGFRVYRTTALKFVLPLLRAKGFSVQIEILSLICQTTQWENPIHEVPTLYNLTNSTLSLGMVVEALYTLIRMKWRKVWKKHC